MKITELDNNYESKQTLDITRNHMNTTIVNHLIHNAVQYTESVQSIVQSLRSINTFIVPPLVVSRIVTVLLIPKYWLAKWTRQVNLYHHKPTFFHR